MKEKQIGFIRILVFLFLSLFLRELVFDNTGDITIAWRLSGIFFLLLFSVLYYYEVPYSNCLIIFYLFFESVYGLFSSPFVVGVANVALNACFIYLLIGKGSKTKGIVFGILTPALLFYFISYDMKINKNDRIGYYLKRRGADSVRHPVHDISAVAPDGWVFLDKDDYGKSRWVLDFVKESEKRNYLALGDFLLTSIEKPFLNLHIFKPIKKEWKLSGGKEEYIYNFLYNEISEDVGNEHEVKPNFYTLNGHNCFRFDLVKEGVINKTHTFLVNDDYALEIVSIILDPDRSYEKEYASLEETIKSFPFGNNSGSFFDSGLGGERKTAMFDFDRSPRELVEDGYKLFDQREFEQAIHFFEKAHALYPMHLGLTIGIAETAHELADYQTSISKFLAIYDDIRDVKGQEGALVNYKMATAYDKLGQRNDYSEDLCLRIIYHIEKSIELEPDIGRDKEILLFLEEKIYKYNLAKQKSEGDTKEYESIWDQGFSLPEDKVSIEEKEEYFMKAKLRLDM